MVSLGTTVYQSSRRIQDLLQAVNLFLRNTDEQAVLIVKAGRKRKENYLYISISCSSSKGS